MNEHKKHDLKELVLQKRDEGKVVYLTHEGTESVPISEFIRQPADGILYDLNRLEEIALTYMDDPKWINDFAVALTIRALKEERNALLAVADYAVHDVEACAVEGKRVDEFCTCGFNKALAALPEHLK